MAECDGETMPMECVKRFEAGAWTMAQATATLKRMEPMLETVCTTLTDHGDRIHDLEVTAVTLKEKTASNGVMKQRWSDRWWGLLSGVALLAAGAVIAVVCSGCVTSYTVDETATGDLDKPALTRKTTGFTWNPWGEVPVPKTQGAMTARAGNASSGETSWFDPISAGSGLHPLYIIGGIVILAGAAVGILLKDWMNGLLIAGAGAALIAYVFLIETYPMVMLAIFLLAIGAGAWVVYQMYVKKRGNKTATLTVEAIDEFKKAEPNAWKKMKPYLDKAHDGSGAVRAQVDKLRRGISKKTNLT